MALGAVCQKNTFFIRLLHGVRSVLPKNRNSALIPVPTCYRVDRLSHFCGNGVWWIGYLIFVEMAYGAFCIL